MIDKRRMNAELFALLRDWCGALLRLQIDMPHRPELDGALLCPACGAFHGRCVDAVYPLLVMADRTGEAKYRTAAERLFLWGENLRNADGSIRNDPKSDWRGVTVFYAIALHDALALHGGQLAEGVREMWRARLLEMGEWLYANLAPGAKAYINYYAANACAMALLGRMFDRNDYLARAKELADYCLRHVSESGLVFGESAPHDAITPKGCRAIDVGGYSAEETLPALTRYARAAADGEALGVCKALWLEQLRWMTPDGAWDDSVGVRNFKWTYWGSRTSDGCQDALFALGRDDPLFAEAAWRNLLLYRACTHDGLLYGGMDYFDHGEAPCVHHTFCHAKTLAGTLDAGTYDFKRVPLPADAPEALRYYPELATYRIAFGGWRADVTAFDFPHRRSSHASGGAISLLWHESCGAVIAAGQVDFALAEPNNQQLPRDEAGTRSACPRIEAQINGRRYGQQYDFAADMTAEAADNTVTVRVQTALCSADHAPLDGGRCTLQYTFQDDALRIEGSVDPALAADARYILPIIADTVEVDVLRGTAPDAPERIFCLSPGFEGREYAIRPDGKGRFGVRIMQNHGSKADRNNHDIQVMMMNNA